MTDRVVLSVKAYYKNETTIDIDVLKTITEMSGQAELAKLLPIPPSTTAVMSSIDAILKVVFEGSIEKDIVEEREVRFLEPMAGGCCQKTAVAELPIVINMGDAIGKRLRIYVRVATERSRFSAFDERQGKFVRRPPISILETTGANFAGAQASLLQLLRTSSAPADQQARGLLETVLAGRMYDAPDLDQRCGALYGALHRYVTGPDAKALFWAFFQRYRRQFLEGTACLAGYRAEELADIGLTIAP